MSALPWRWEAIAAVGGGGLALLIGSVYVETLFSLPLPAAFLYRTLGTAAPVWLGLFNALGGAAILFVSARIVLNLRAQWQGEQPSPRPAPVARYRLPPWPQAQRSLVLTLGEQHQPDGRFVQNPTWYRLPETGLFGNLIAFGGIGSGKTQGVAYPLLRQMFEYQSLDRAQRMGGLILDVKGDFTEQVLALAAEKGRQAEVIVVRPGLALRWNPLHQPELGPEVLAGRLVAVYQNLTADSGKGEHAWIQQGVLTLLTHAIGILRLAQGYLTLNDVNGFLNRVTEGNAKTLPDNVERSLAELALAAPDLDLEDSEWSYHAVFFTRDWVNQNDRSRAIVVNATKNVIGQFSQPEIRQTFCPQQEEITFPGFAAAIDRGLVVVLDMPVANYGPLAKTIGTLLKLEFQRAVLGRVARARVEPQANTRRNLFFVCDEYQNFVTASGSLGEGDDNFFALSRQSRCISLVLTQSPISLVAKVGEDAARVIFASLRSKIFLALVDPKDAELAADICGQDWTTIEHRGVSERAERAGWNPVSGQHRGASTSVGESRQFTQQRTYLIEPITLLQLRMFEAVVAGFNGLRRIEPTRVFVKTDFVPPALAGRYAHGRELPYCELLAALENEA